MTGYLLALALEFLPRLYARARLQPRLSPLVALVALLFAALWLTAMEVALPIDIVRWLRARRWLQ